MPIMYTLVTMFPVFLMLALVWQTENKMVPAKRPVSRCAPPAGVDPNWFKRI